MVKKEIPDPLYVSQSTTATLIFGDNNQHTRAKVKRLIQGGYLMINDPVSLKLPAHKSSKEKNLYPWIITESVNQYIMAAKNGALDAHKKELAKKINN